MITCPSCNTPNREEAKFCGFCGFQLTASALTPAQETTEEAQKQACPICDKLNEAHAKFCEFCGAALMQAAPGTAPAPTTPPAPAEPIEEPMTAPSDTADTPPTDQSPVPPIDTPDDGTGEAEAVEESPASDGGPDIRCASCGTVIRYCPTCGQPLDAAGQHTTSDASEADESAVEEA